MASLYQIKISSYECTILEKGWNGDPDRVSMCELRHCFRGARGGTGMYPFIIFQGEVIIKNPE